jgi:hypothetical protein
VNCLLSVALAILHYSFNQCNPDRRVLVLIQFFPEVISLFLCFALTSTTHISLSAPRAAFVPEGNTAIQKLFGKFPDIDSGLSVSSIIPPDSTNLSLVQPLHIFSAVYLFTDCC